MTTLPTHLRPDRRGIVRAFWDAAARGELRLPRCAVCASFGWPPRVRCAVCGSGAIEWMRASGSGSVHTFTIVRQTSEPYFAARLPYVVAMIDLDEGARLMGNVVGCSVDAVRIGMRVAVSFVDAGDGVAIPVFAPR
jgi:uncharacterized OB-fold protein